MPNDIMLAKVFFRDASKDKLSAVKFAGRPGLLLSLTLAILAFAVFSASYTWLEAFKVTVRAVSGVLLLTAVCCFTVYIHMISVIRRDMKCPVNLRSEGQVYFYGDRFIYSDKTTTSVINYDYVTKAYESDDYFYMFTAPSMVFPAPKSGFMFPKEKEVLREFLSVRLKKKFKIIKGRF